MDVKPSAADTDRREFLRRVVGGVLGITGVSAIGLALWDRSGPDLDVATGPVDLLPEYAIADQAGRVAVVRGEDRVKSVTAAIAALGGMDRFVRPGDRVLLKVNAAFAAPPVIGATTHPDTVARVIGLCREAGAAHVAVTDNPINDPAACFALSGIDAAARSAGAQVILPTADRFETYTLPGGRLIRRWPVLTAPLRGMDKVIGLAPVKDHHRSGASMTLKNWYGLLGGRRNIFHQQIHTIIAELAMLIKPTLVILDGTTTMMHNGPTGGSMDDLKATHTLIAGTDPVAVDAAGAELLGKTAADLPHLGMAAEAGAGRLDWRTILVNR